MIEHYSKRDRHEFVPGAYSEEKTWKQTNGSTDFKNQGAPKIY